MAKRMTDREREAARALSRMLTSVADKGLRGNASGIAGALVRLGEGPVSADAVGSVLAGYGCSADAIPQMIDAGALVLEEVAGSEAVYRVSMQPTAKPPQPSGAARKNAEPRRDLAKVGPRKLAEVPHVRKQTPSALELRTQIIGLDPRLWLNGWLLGYPAVMELYGDEVRALDRALSRAHDLGSGEFTCRELSYRIFGDEKFLEFGGDGRKLLDRMGVWDLFEFKNPPRPELQVYAPSRRDRMRVVVSENLDPWIAMRDALYLEGRRLILGERVHAVVFGDGNRVADGRKLADVLESLAADEVEILYWGDIDRAGVQLLAKVKAILGDRVTVRPFTAAYERMLRAARDRYPRPEMNESANQDRIPSDGLPILLDVLPADLADYARAVVEGNRLIPQEILTARDL